MPKRIRKPKLDTVQNARRVVLASVGEVDEVEPPVDKNVAATLDSKALISQLMREMGRRGGLKGGKRRLETMTVAERSKAARKAAKARWGKKKHTIA